MTMRISEEATQNYTINLPKKMSTCNPTYIVLMNLDQVGCLFPLSYPAHPSYLLYLLCSRCNISSWEDKYENIISVQKFSPI